MLTIRVYFKDNDKIGKSLQQSRRMPMWMIEMVGAAVLLAWMAPVWAVAHGMAEVSIASLGIAISIVISTFVNTPEGRWSFLHDVASVAVMGVAWAYTHYIPSVFASTHGEFVAAVAIGSSSLHSLRTMAEALTHPDG